MAARGQTETSMVEAGQMLQGATATACQDHHPRTQPSAPRQEGRVMPQDQFTRCSTLLLSFIETHLT